MGRPRGSKNKAKDGTPGPGHNGPPADLSDEQRQVLFFKHKKKWAAVQAKIDGLIGARKEVETVAKAELGKKAVADIKLALKIETPAGEAELKAEVERQMRIARWMAVPFGTQADMFADRTPSVDQARAAGKAARLQGEPKKPPHDPSVPQYDAWMEGWDEGQRALNEAQRRDDAAAFGDVEPHVNADDSWPDEPPPMAA